MAEIIAIFAWPLIFLVAFLLFILFFRKNINGLLKSIKISRGNFKACLGKEEQVIQNSSKKLPEPLEKLYNSPTVNILIQDLKKDPQLQLQDKDELIETLFHRLALRTLAAKSEEVYSLIFGSQLNLLMKVNNSIVITEEFAREWYSATIAEKPNLTNFTYDRYMNFFLHFGLLIRHEKGYEITFYGREFILYLTLTGKNFTLAY
jgi:Sec-independent protein translocase protein TatA